jgi:IS30 family transposase
MFRSRHGNGIQSPQPRGEMPPARHDGDGLSLSEIARRLGRHRSTVQRELARNRCVDGYRLDSAGRRAWARKLRGLKIARSTRLRAHVEDRLAMGWSPEQIAGRMEQEGAEHRLSAESIYRHAYSPAGRRAGRLCPWGWCRSAGPRRGSRLIRPPLRAA